MPDNKPTYNRSADFLDTGYTNVPPQTQFAPEGTPQQQAPAQSKDVLDFIFSNLDKNVRQTNPFISSLQYTTPIKFPLKDALRYQDPVLGYDPFNPNLEYMYGDKQSGWEKWGNNLVKFGANTLGALVETLAAIPQTISAVSQGDISKAFDNDLTNNVSEWLNNLENNLPNYETTFERDHPILKYVPGFASLGTMGDSWGTVLKSLGFIAGTVVGAILQDAAIASVTGGIGEAPLVGPQIMRIMGKMGKVFSSAETTGSALGSIVTPTERIAGGLYNTGRATTATESFTRGKDLLNAINKTSQTRNILNKFRYGTAFTTSVLAQGTIFANETYNTVKTELTEKFKESAGRDPNRDDMALIEEYAKGAGNADLYTNVALLALIESNVLGSLFRPTALAKKAVSKEAVRGIPIGLAAGSKDVFERIKATSKFDIIANKLPTDALKSIGFGTAFVGGTALISRTAEDYYKRKFDDPSINTTNNFMLSLGTGLRDTFNTREGTEGLLMGALIGGVMHGGKKLIERAKGIDTNRKALIDSSVAWLNSERLSGLFTDTYNEAVTSEHIKRGMEDAIVSGNIFEYKNLKFEQLYNFVDSGVRSNRFDLRVDQLNMLKEMPQSEFERMFKLPFNDGNRRLVNDFADSIISKSYEIKENIDKVSEVFPNPYNIKSKDPDELLNYRVFEEYKTQLSLDLSQMKDNRRRLEQVLGDISKTVPLLDKEKTVKLVSEQGIEETIEALNKRTEEINTSLELIEDKKSPEYKKYSEEKKFVEDKVKQLESHLKEYDPRTYPRLAEDLMNYYVNHGTDFKNRVSPIDVLPTLEKAKDAFSLINSTDRALFHYQQLISKEGFDDFIKKATEQRAQQEEKFNNSAIAQKLVGSPETKPVTTESPKTDEAEIDKKGNIKPSTGTIEVKETTKPIVDEVTGEKTGEKQGKAFTYTDPEGGRAFGSIEGGVARISGMNAGDVKRRGFFRKLIDALKGKGATSVKIGLQSDDTRESIKKLIDDGTLTNPREMAGVSVDEHPTLFDIGKKPLESGEEILSIVGPVEEVVFPEDFGRTKVLERPDDSKQVEAEQIEEEKIKGKRSDLFENFAPITNFNRLFSQNFSDIKHYDNLRDQIFKGTPESVYNTLEIKTHESTEGKKAGEWKPFPGFDNIFYQGYKTDVELVSEGKVVGLITPIDRLAFKRGDEYVPFTEITQDEYEKVTKNNPATYGEFMSQLADYKKIVDKIRTDFEAGKTSYTNEEVKDLFDVHIIYGRAEYSQGEGTSTKIKDLKYKTEGDAVLSLPMVYDKASDTYQRTFQPNLLNKADLSEADFQKLWRFVGDNIERLRNLDSRYIYIFKMPNGEYELQSPIVARPSEQDPAILDAVFQVIKTVTLGSVSEEKRANTRLKDTLYIADSRNRKGSKTNLSLEFNRGNLYFKVGNESKKFRKAYVIETKDLRNFEDLVAALNMKIVEKSSDPKLAKLNIRLDIKDFKASILKDENATMKELEGKLAVSTFPYPFKDYRMFILPKSEQVKTEPKPTDIKPSVEGSPLNKKLTEQANAAEELISKKESLNDKDFYKWLDTDEALRLNKIIGQDEFEQYRDGKWGREHIVKPSVEGSGEASPKAKEEVKPPVQKNRWLTPIPAGSEGYWGHLSEIQRAFMEHRYDEPFSKGEISEAQLRAIIASTTSKENKGMSSGMVDDLVFRTGNQDIINDIEYWKNPPKSAEDKNYVNYVKTIKEVIRNGQLAEAIKKEIISPEEADNILKASNQTSKVIENTIKDKLKEVEEKQVEIEKIDTKAEEEPEALAPEEPAVIQEFEKDEDVLYNDKPYKVKDVETTASGAKLYIISDGTKYGEKPVYPEKLQKIVKQVVTEKEVLQDVLPTEFRGTKELSPTEQELADEQDNKLLNFVGLKTLMERLKNKFNIPYKIVEGEGDWKGRFDKGTVIINSLKYDNSTPFHEYLHPFIAVMKVENPNLYKALAKELGINTYGKKVIDEVRKNPFYKDKTPEEVGDESLVRYISKASAQSVTSEGRRIKNKFYEAMKGLLDRFRSWLSGTLKAITWKDGGMVANVAKIPEEATLQDIADLVSLHDMKFDMTKQSDLINAFQAYQKDINTLSDEQRIVSRLSHSLRTLEDTAKRRFPSDELLSNVITVRSILKDAEAVDSIDRYLGAGIRGLKYAGDEFKRISGKLKDPDNPLTKEDITDLSRSMGVVKSLIAFYKEDVDYLLKKAAKTMSFDQYTDYLQVIADTDSTINQIKSKTVDIITEWLYPTFEEAHRLNEKYPEFKLTKKEFKNQIYAASGDMDGLAFIFSAISTSKDPVNATAHAMIKSLYEDTNMESHEAGIKIKVDYDNFLKDKGLKNEKNQTEDYYKKNYLRKASILEKVGEDEDGKPIEEYKDYWAYHEKYMHDLFQKAREDYMESIKFDPENQKHIDDLIRWEGENTKEIEVDGFKERVPVDKYLNPEFEKLYGKDKFFTTMYDHYKEANEKLGEEERLEYGIVPQVSKGKGAFSDYDWKEPVQAAKTFGTKVVEFILPKDQEQAVLNEQVKKLTAERKTKLEKVGAEGLTPEELKRKSEQIEEYYDDAISKLAASDNIAKNLDGSYYRNIKTPYVRRLVDEDLDLGLPETLVKFYDSAIRTSALREIEPNVALLRSIIESDSKFIPEVRKVLKTTSKGNLIFDRIANLPADKEQIAKRLNKQLKHFLDTVVYGEGEDKATLDLFGLRQIDLNKLGQNWSFMTSTLTMAGNVTAALSNVVIGEVNSFGEALGGKFWTVKNWRDASGKYLTSLPEFFSDVTRFKKSLITQFGIKYDAIQGEFRDKYGKRIVGNVMQRYTTGDTLFILTHAGEHEIQLKAMVSLMLATPVKMADGSLSNLYDAHEINKEGFLKLKKEALWGHEDDKAFTSRLHGVNKYLNGIYNQFDRVYAQRKWYGKAALIFRKHLYSSLKARWGKPYYDIEIRDKMSGFYRDFFKKLSSDIRDYKLGAATKFFKREGWSDDERYAFNRTTFELGMFASMIILGATIARGESEDKKNTQWGQQYLNLLMLRLRSDLGQYNVAGLIDFVNIVKNPSVVVSTLSKFQSFFGQLVYDPFETYKRKTGYFDKGDSILFAKFAKILPFYNQWIKLKTPDEQAKFYQLINKR